MYSNNVVPWLTAKIYYFLNMEYYSKFEAWMAIKLSIKVVTFLS